MAQKGVHITQGKEDINVQARTEITTALVRTVGSAVGTDQVAGSKCEASVPETQGRGSQKESEEHADDRYEAEADTGTEKMPPRPTCPRRNRRPPVCLRR